MSYYRCQSGGGQAEIVDWANNVKRLVCSLSTSHSGNGAGVSFSCNGSCTIDNTKGGIVFEVSGGTLNTVASTQKLTKSAGGSGSSGSSGYKNYGNSFNTPFTYFPSSGYPKISGTVSTSCSGNGAGVSYNGNTTLSIDNKERIFKTLTVGNNTTDVTSKDSIQVTASYSGSSGSSGYKDFGNSSQVNFSLN